MSGWIRECMDEQERGWEMDLMWQEQGKVCIFKEFEVGDGRCEERNVP